ncbi:5804_t:CDS:2, partial [Scutellospora calospora]
FTTVNTAITEDIDQLFDTILRLDQTILKTNKTWKTVKNKTKFKEFFEYCCQSHHYIFSIKKSNSGNNDHYASLNNVYSQDTTEIYHLSLANNNHKKSYSMLFNDMAQRAKNVDVTIMCLECEHWQLFYSKQKLNEKEKKLLITYLDIIDYSCGSSFYNAENISKKCVSSEIKSSNSEHKNLFYKNADINNELTESDNYDIEELANSEKNDNNFSEFTNNNESNELVDNEENIEELANNKKNNNDFSEFMNNNESNQLVDNEERNYNSEAKNLSSLDADKTTIKELFEKVFINDRLTCNSLIEKAYHSAQIFSLLCFKCDNTDIVTPIPATQYQLYTECTQKGVKTPTRGKSLKFTA